MSSFLNFACGAVRSRSPRGILRLAVLNPCAVRGISRRVLSARAARDEALRSFANLSLKQNFGFEILKQVLKFVFALAFFGRNSFFKIYARFKFKDGLQKRGCLASPIAVSTAVPPSSAATLPTETLPALAAFLVSTRAQASALVQTQASTPPSEQIQARMMAKFKSIKFKSAIFKFAASQLAVAGRAIFKFTKFTIFSQVALKFKNSQLAQRRALV